MNVEQRLLRVFDQADRVEPSTDLWSRVVHSIDEDRRHRSRVVRTVLAGLVGLAVLVGAGALSLTDAASGRVVRWEVMEALETAALAALIVALGPGIRRFGRGYADDLFTSNRSVATSMLRLLDVAYFLVFSGYILLSAQFLSALEQRGLTLGEQLEEAGARVGGLLLIMGVLHAITLATVPLMALVVNATRSGRKVPRWIWLLLLVGAAAALVLAVLVAGSG